MSEAARSVLYQDVEEDAALEFDPSVETSGQGQSDWCEADAQDAKRSSSESNPTEACWSQSDQDEAGFLRDMENSQTAFFGGAERLRARNFRTHRKYLWIMLVWSS